MSKRSPQGKAILSNPNPLPALPPTGITLVGTYQSTLARNHSRIIKICKETPSGRLGGFITRILGGGVLQDLHKPVILF